MNSCTRFAIATLAIAATVFLSGCTAERKWSIGSGNEVEVSEINQDFHFDTWCQVTWLDVDGQVYVVLISDCGGGSTFGDNKGNNKGTLEARGGQAAWSCPKPDGKNGKIVIDDQDFDLEKGGLFLVRFRDKKAVVEQVSVDMAQFQGGAVNKKVRNVADKRVQAFITAGRHDWDFQQMGAGLNASISWLLIDRERKYFLMASVGVDGEHKTSRGVGVADGKIKTKDGRDLTWSCATVDGKSGKVVIDSQEFDLEKGGVFLVLAKDKKTTVEQVNTDMGPLHSHPKTGLDEPRIAAFLKANAKEK
jgi:hypothetical protein